MHDNEQFKVPCFASGCTNTQNNNQTYNARFLALPLDVQILKTTIKLTFAVTEKLTNVDESTTKLSRIGSAWGTGPAALNR